MFNSGVQQIGGLKLKGQTIGEAMSKPSRTITDTEKAQNLSVEVDGSLKLDEMEVVLFSAANDLGLKLSHVTTLSRKKYPGNRHWHFKQYVKSKGCLDVTYWPDGALFWITIRSYEPDWVHAKGSEMSALMKNALSTPEP